MNFDNSLDGMVTLFIMMLGENWKDMMFRGMDSTDVGLEPQFNASSYFVGFFVLYMIVGSLFIINLFVGVVIDNFNKNKERNEHGSAFMTESQKQWIQMQQIGQRLNLRRKNLEPDGNRKYIFRVVHHAYFENFITSMVLLNTICMAIVHYKMDPELKFVLKLLNYFFAFVFNMEMIMKLISL